MAALAAIQPVEDSIDYPCCWKSSALTMCCLELGGNDGLRGQPLSLMKRNLQTMIELCRQAGAEPVLFGMRLPPNYGRRYSDAFAAVYPQLSDEQQVVLIPFQLEELAITEGMIQEDGLHPTALAQPIIKDVVKSYIEPLMN